MTNDDIIKMARVAGYGDFMADIHAPALQRFAEAVAAAERLACIADVRRSRLSLDGTHGVSHETSYIADRVLDNAVRKIEERDNK